MSERLLTRRGFLVATLGTGVAAGADKLLGPESAEAVIGSVPNPSFEKSKWRVPFLGQGSRGFDLKRPIGWRETDERPGRCNYEDGTAYKGRKSVSVGLFTADATRNCRLVSAGWATEAKIRIDDPREDLEVGFWAMREDDQKDESGIIQIRPGLILRIYDAFGKHLESRVEQRSLNDQKVWDEFRFKVVDLPRKAASVRPILCAFGNSLAPCDDKQVARVFFDVVSLDVAKT